MIITKILTFPSFFNRLSSGEWRKIITYTIQKVTPKAFHRPHHSHIYSSSCYALVLWQNSILDTFLLGSLFRNSITFFRLFSVICSRCSRCVYILQISWTNKLTTSLTHIQSLSIFFFSEWNVKEFFLCIPDYFIVK